MNPSYDSSGQNAAGNSGIPGVKPGVIASGPDTPEASVPGVANSLGGLSVGGNSQNPNGVFGRLSRIPGGSRPNSSSSNGFNNGNTGPITPQPIDKIIIDGGGGPKRSKRGLLVAGIALIGVALVVGVVAFIVMSKENEVILDETTALNNMTRYMLFGDIENVDAVSGVGVNDATFSQMSRNEFYGEQEEYFNKAEDHIKMLLKASKNQDLIQQATEIMQKTTLLSKFGEVAYASAFWLKYLENGKAGVQNYMGEMEGIILANGATDDIMATNQQLADDSVRVYEIYSSNGCLNNDEIDLTCVNGVLENDAVLGGLTNASADMRVEIREYMRTLVDEIFSIIMTVNGVTEDA